MSSSISIQKDPLAPRCERTMKLARVVACTIGLACGSASVAQQPSPGPTPDSASLRSVIDRVAGDAVQRRLIPNLLVAVSRRGERQFMAYSVSGSSSFARDTVVEIGSITKIFTGALYAEAVQEGLMKPDASLRQYLPAGVEVGRCTAAVTLQDLASFRSGMPLLPDDAPRRLVERSERNYTVDNFYEWLSSWTPIADGTTDDAASSRNACGLPARYAYSNASVGLLGLLIENAYGTSWDKLIAARITGPLGAVDTAVATGWSQQSRIAQGHGPRGEPVMPWPRFAWFAAGALRSTAEDMLSYGEAALGHRTVNGRPVPDALTRALAYSMQPLYRPEGKPFTQGVAPWALRPIDVAQPDGARFASKDGGTDGFNSMLIVDSRDDLTIFAVADMAKSGVPAIGIEILKRWATGNASDRGSYDATEMPGSEEDATTP